MFKYNIALTTLIFFIPLQFLLNVSEAAPKCTHLKKMLSGELLQNTCSSCRVIKIQRKRPGAVAPINRTYTIPENSNTKLSFRGPGQSRILSDIPCKSNFLNKIKNKRTKNSETKEKKCIELKRVNKTGVPGLALLNNCDQCRIAVVDRIDSIGSSRLQNIVLAGKSVITLPAMGAVRAGVKTEKSCK